MSKSLEQQAQEWLLISTHLDSHGTACFLIEELLAENKRLKAAVAVGMDKLKEYAEADEEASGHGSGCYTDPQREISYAITVMREALEGGDER